MVYINQLQIEGLGRNPEGRQGGCVEIIEVASEALGTDLAGSGAAASEVEPSEWSGRHPGVYVHPIGGPSRSEGDDRMGIIDGLFGPKHPPLPDTSAAVQRLGDEGEAFETFVAKANDRIDIVVGDGPLYLYMGKPPKAFGVVWFENGERNDVRSLMERGILTPQTAGGLVGDFGDIYRAYSTNERFSYHVAGRNVIVTPSPEFHRELHEAVVRARNA